MSFFIINYLLLTLIRTYFFLPFTIFKLLNRNAKSHDEILWVLKGLFRKLRALLRLLRLLR